ncbi:MAG: DUF4845 domain-containing protein [Guyparkeria sp.]
MENSVSREQHSGMILRGVTDPGRQRGMSLVGLVIAAIVLGFAALVVMQVVPLYIADQKLKTIFKSLEEESAGSPAEIRRKIDKQLDINEADDRFDSKEFDIRPVTGGFNVTYNYDGRATLLGNLSLVAEFRHQTRVRN